MKIGTGTEIKYSFPSVVGGAEATGVHSCCLAEVLTSNLRDLCDFYCLLFTCLLSGSAIALF